MKTPHFKMEYTMTISEAAELVLKNADKALSVDEIYAEIIQQNLFTFGAKNPKSVMSQAIKHRSDANSNAKSVIFKSHEQGIYSLVD